MITRIQTRPIVEFHAASPRMARAYRTAARKNRRLARFARMRAFPSPPSRAMPKHGDTIERVVLSHVDDDHRVLADERAQPIVADAFHLLFTESATHPDQIAQWMRSTNIRSENRLHVVRADDLESPAVSALLARVCLALGSSDAPEIIIDAYLAGDSLLVRGPRHRMLHVPLDRIPALRGQPRDVVRNFEIDADGSFVHWPSLDVHLGWNQLLRAVDPEELRRALRKTAGYNRAYGAAIRKAREEAGLSQSKVTGIAERHLRRIEQGECGATSKALAALAKAHRLDTNAYMELLAKTMK